MQNKTKTNLLIDSLILIAVLIANEPVVTGMEIHEWFSLALVVALLIHIVLHWEWIVALTIKFLKKLFHESRLHYTVDLLLFLAFITVNLSGLMISKSILPALGIRLTVLVPAWRSIHSLSADITLLLTGLHFALHLTWVTHNIQRFILTPLRTLFQRPKQSAPLAQNDLHQ